MDVVNVTGLNPGFFITVALFVLFILSMLSMGVLRLFQQRSRPAVYYIIAGAAGIIAFVIVLTTWFA